MIKYLPYGENLVKIGQEDPEPHGLNKLRELACHMESRSVTCHPTEVHSHLYPS